MKVGDTVKWVGSDNLSKAATRYVLVEHHGDRGVIRAAGADATTPGDDVPIAELALAENAPAVVDPADD